MSGRASDASTRFVLKETLRSFWSIKLRTIISFTDDITYIKNDDLDVW